MTAYAKYTLNEFVTAQTDSIVARLIRSDAASGFSQFSHAQGWSWEKTIEILRNTARSLINSNSRFGNFGLVLEYRIPRREKRLDAAILLANTVVVIEFKAGSDAATPAAVTQVLDYALDLAYYHAESRRLRIVPVVCSTEMAETKHLPAAPNTPLQPGYLCGGAGLTEVMIELSPLDGPGNAISIEDWCNSPYRPIPGVIEAAVRLFSGHDVKDISSALAADRSIQTTIDNIASIIRDSIAHSRKALCLVTGVPGAGKTLVGLRLAHSPEFEKSDWRSAFLSGNGPLLKVLRSALAAHYQEAEKCTGKEASAYASTMIHSVHSFLDEAKKGQLAPAEQIIIFDEAQRAWDAEKIERMANRQRLMGGRSESSPDTTILGASSEPSQIMSALDRHKSGAVAVALCGTGQEIHDGEAGIDEWVSVWRRKFTHWDIFLSPEAAALTNSPDLPGSAVVPSLHLKVPVRAHRATGHTEWVDAVLSGNLEKSTSVVNQAEFPLLVTRDLDAARAWLRKSTLGTRRCGLLASSSAIRLRPYGIEVSAGFRKEVDFPAWFTAKKGNLKASYALEIAATEFECQGLELDRTCVCWCWDLLLAEGSVSPRTFQRDTWLHIKKPRVREYAINKYRVLLTRAREGMVIWIPAGESEDHTRSPSEADAVYNYLVRCGAAAL